MLNSYSHQKNILNSANNLLANSVLYNVIELKKLNSKGCKFTLYKCDYCDKIFNLLSDESIFCFFCGHKFHLKCCTVENSSLLCEICRKNDFDYIDSEVKVGGNNSLIERVNLIILSFILLKINLFSSFRVLTLGVQILIK